MRTHAEPSRAAAWPVQPVLGPWPAFTWALRRGFWNALACFKAFMNKPLDIPRPVAGPEVRRMPLSQAIPRLAIERVQAVARRDIPADERVTRASRFYDLQVWLYRAFSPMQRGLPPVDPDPQVALDRAFTRLHRHFMPPPVLPAELLGPADLGGLAVRGPYACYTRRSAEGGFEWDFSALAAYGVHEGLLPVGATLHFEVDPVQRRLRPAWIATPGGGRVQPGERGWDRAVRVVLCAATTHLSLVRHFNHAHLAAGAHLAVATRNHLAPDHPLRRLLWPYVFATQQSNDMVTRGQMLRGGDFECTFSFTHDAMCRLFDDTHGEHRFTMNDPAVDARERGVLDAGFDTPTEDNLARLFEPMLEHAAEYLRLYWPDDAALAADGALRAWLDDLAQWVPNGVGLRSATLDHAGLARLVARIIYLVSAQHEIVGGFLWNYQLWTHRQPVRVRCDGDEREPLDVYQRLLNANFNLNVRRRPLMDAFDSLAVDRAGADCLQRFQQRLEALQQAMEREPWAVWKLYPRALKVNINA